MDPSGSPPKAKRKAGATGTRLSYTAAPSQDIRRRQRKTRQPRPVTITHADGTTEVVTADRFTPQKKRRDPTPKQRRYLKALAARAGIPVPRAKTRAQASIAIGQLEHRLGIERNVPAAESQKTDS